jgi:F-type H+-transporting ATPase subunit epsilon
MIPSPMHLKVLLPFQVYSETLNVLSIIAETQDGSFGILPHRRDCIAVLPPGLLTYKTEGGVEIFLAIDEGVLVKTDLDVVISVRSAIQGTDLDKLRDLVKKEFLVLDESEKQLKLVMSKLENNLIRRLMDFQHA